VTNKKREFKRKTEKEMKKVVGAFVLESPTTTDEGIREYRRLERQIQKTVNNDKSLSKWQWLKQAFKDFWNEELTFPQNTRKKKRG